MATSCLTALSSSSQIPNNKTSITVPQAAKPFGWSPLANSISFRYSGAFAPSLSHSYGAQKKKKLRDCSVLAVANEEVVVGAEIDSERDEHDDLSGQETGNRSRPCELYVCNLPRSCGITQLLEMFKPLGTVLSVEVSRNPETGESRGCGYVTMSSINSAKMAIAALDGTDVGGREMRVRFSVEMNSRRRNPAVLNSTPKKILIYESPYKVYVGNLAWATKPDELRNHFSQFGTVVSVRVLHDRKAGKNRVFGFLSYSSPAERDAALSLDRTEYQGRRIIVREGVERMES